METSGPIVVTGATGLVGRALSRRLAQAGENMVAVTRRPDGIPSSLGCPATSWDEVGSVLKGARGIIHLAGENIAAARWTRTRKAELRRSRVETARALGRWVHEPLDFVVSVSAVGIYGDRGNEWLDESSPAGGDFLAGLCVEWEEAALSIPAKRHTIGRLGLVLAPDAGFLGRVVPLFKVLGASPLGSGSSYMSWIHIDDVVRFLVQAVGGEDLSGRFNLIAPEPVTNKEFTVALATRLGVPIRPAVPAWALRLRYGEMSDVLLGSQRCRPARLLSHDWGFSYGLLTKALDQIFPH